MDVTAKLEHNLSILQKKVDELDKLRVDIAKSINGAKDDFRKRMAFAELLKSLTDIDKTILAYIKEANTMLYKMKNYEEGDNLAKEGNILLSLITDQVNQAKEKHKALKEHNK